MTVLLLSLCFQAAAVPATTASEVFTLYGEDNIMEEEHFQEKMEQKLIDQQAIC